MSETNVSYLVVLSTTEAIWVHLNPYARMCEKNVKNICLCLHAKALFVCVCAYVYICVEVFMLIHVIFG